MSTKRSFGRFTAMGLAGLTAVSSMAIVANAEAYPSYVYEFTYGGVATTQVYYKAINAVADNTYVKYTDQTTAQGVFKDDTGFKVDGLTAFWAEVDKAYTVYTGNDYNCTDKITGGWQYKIPNSFAAGGKIEYVEESYEKRSGDTLEWTYAFKSAAERNKAMSDIASKNKSNYTAKYNAASSALSKDFTDAINAYKKAQSDAISKAQKEVNDYFAANPTKDTYSISATDISALDGGSYAIARKENTTDPSTTLTLSEWVKRQNDYVNDQVKTLTETATQAKSEFTEAYQVSNWAFDYDAAKDGATTATDAAPFVSADGPVTFGGSVGSYIKYSTAKYTTLATKELDLTKDYYRTIGQYNDPTSYAFSGEIILAADRSSGTLANVKALCLDSDRWSQFSALMEGKPSDNGNTTESGNGGTSTTTPTTPTTVTGEWYPGDANYRTANTSGISYEGKNGKWYTSVGAAALYGGGYTGSSKTSNYSSVKSNSTLYFSADDGNYYKSASDAGSHSYLVKNTTTTSSTTNYNDPYYYYFMMGNGTTTIDPDAPAIYGSKKRSGWDRITSYIKASKTGATVKIDMNAATTVPASVLAAAKDKGVNLLFVNENGSKVTVKAGSVSTSSALDVSVTYNVKNVRSSLVKAAKKANPGTVSTAQIKVGTAGSLGGTATVTVKMSAKRAGDTVKAYRLTDSGKLTREALGVVKADGTLSFNVKNGGSYLLVVIE